MWYQASADSFFIRSPFEYMETPHMENSWSSTYDWWSHQEWPQPAERKLTESEYRQICIEACESAKVVQPTTEKEIQTDRNAGLRNYCFLRGFFLLLTYNHGYNFSCKVAISGYKHAKCNY